MFVGHYAAPLGALGPARFLLFNWLSGVFGSPPPSERALAWFALTSWLIIPWAWWVDRHRS